jgi:hypothetical protein
MIVIIPLWQRGIEGDFKNMTYPEKISPHPPLPKRGEQNENFAREGKEKK